MTQSITQKTGSIYRLFARYVSQNILGMIGLSAYVLADTFFISQAEGSRGITFLMPLSAMTMHHPLQWQLPFSAAFLILSWTMY